MSQFTTTSNCGYEVGDTLILQSRELRWWVRIWNYITFQKHKNKDKVVTITKVTGNIIYIDGDCY